jgi:orotidine-5'-phosphate decarboxylase
LFLAPGYGAQGGDASGIRPLLDSSGRGVLINSSRNLLYAYENTASDDYKKAAEEAAHRTRDELRLIAAGL